MDGAPPARQPPTTSPSPHRASKDVAKCADAGSAGAMCTEGWCECARAVVPWRAGSAPLKGAALRQCQTQECGGDSRPPPPRRQPLSVQTGKSGRVVEHRGFCDGPFLTLDRSACPQNARAPACAPERAPSVAAACPPPPRMPQHRYPSGSAEIRVCEHVCECGNGQALPALTQTARESPFSSMRPASNSTRPSVRTRGCWAALYRRKVSIGPVGADEYQSPGSPGTLTDA